MGVVISVMAVIGFADGWTDIVQFAKAREEWLRTVLELPSGIPGNRITDKTLVYADVDAFRVRTEGAASIAVPAPYGGRIIDHGARVVFRIYKSSYDAIVVVDPQTGSQQLWDDAYRLRDVAASPVGIVLGHGRQYGGPGQLSLITGLTQTREIARTEGVPESLCVDGTWVAFFLEQRAFHLRLGLAESPTRLGALPEPPSRAIAAASGLVGITGDGAWALSRKGKLRRLVAEKKPSFLFGDLERVVVACSRRAWICRGETRASIEAPHGNLHHIAPIDGSDDLILCRGRSVLRYAAHNGRLERIGHGRSGMKLRGAALAGGQLLTWSSRTWRTTSGGGCRAVVPPRTYLID
ncbi:MAG: transposase family protein [Polyangiaceae bacterium]|nr:transposase family protein [Polyangiaceae bacterium]